MEYLRDNELLQFRPNTLESVRKTRGFNSLSEINAAIDILDTWTKKQDHFLKKNFDREYLERVIMSCKGSLERSKKQIDSICTVRNLPSFKMYFEDVDVKNLLVEIADPSKFAFSLLPKLTKDHDRIVIGKENAKKYTFEIQLKNFSIAALLLHFMKYNDFCNSYIFILDVSNTDIPSILTNFSIPEFIKVLEQIFKSYGVKVKEIHLIHSSSFVEALIKLIKFGLPEKLYNRLHVHRNVETIYNYIPVEYLPKDYGGKEVLLDELYVKTINVFSSEEFCKHRREMNSMRTDESKRDTDIFNEQYMGTAGTFRTLSVD